MNLAKRAFRVSVGNFLGFIVYSQGIEVDKNKTKTVLKARAPRNKKELQSLIGKVNFLKRSIEIRLAKLTPFASIKVKGSRRSHLG